MEFSLNKPQIKKIFFNYLCAIKEHDFVKTDCLISCEKEFM